MILQNYYAQIVIVHNQYIIIIYEQFLEIIIRT